MDGYTDLDEGRIDLDNHLIHRLETNRYGFVPWVDSVVRLNNATFLRSDVEQVLQRLPWRNKEPR